MKNIKSYIKYNICEIQINILNIAQIVKSTIIITQFSQKRHNIITYKKEYNDII